MITSLLTFKGLYSKFDINFCEKKSLEFGNSVQAILIAKRHQIRPFGFLNSNNGDKSPKRMLDSRTIASMDFKCQNLIDLFSFSKTATNQFLKFAVLGFNKTREMHEAKIISIGMFCSIFQKRYSAFSTVFIFYLFYTT